MNAKPTPGGCFRDLGRDVSHSVVTPVLSLGRPRRSDAPDGTRRVGVVLAAGKATGDEPSAILAAAAPYLPRPSRRLLARRCSPQRRAKRRRLASAGVHARRWTPHRCHWWRAGPVRRRKCGLIESFAGLLDMTLFPSDLGPYTYAVLAALVAFKLPWLAERWLDAARNLRDFRSGS